ncbi:hypothetical protein IV88_GL001262 [Pediococcus argentinicus]|uniref:Uncharacterized protein n=1 Tax=Pediococcus argentinicus TaxID=480391 RepID=A0A0R2NS06_9LACO|nr:hypothetical protein IV88_GL001262 [Pediococcus argentinicus]
MKNTILRILYPTIIIQILLYLFGFFNWAALVSSHTHPFFNMYSDSFGTLMFWSLLVVISIIGITLSIYLILMRQIPSNSIIGIILALIGFCLPIISFVFLIIPATVLILAAIFIYLLNFKQMN